MTSFGWAGVAGTSRVGCRQIRNNHIVHPYCRLRWAGFLAHLWVNLPPVVLFAVWVLPQVV
jgi:hypothetical protein